MGYTRNPGKGESDSASRKSYSKTGKHDVKDKSGGQSKRYSHFLKTGDPTGGGQVRSGSGLAPEARTANRASAASASAGYGQVGLVQPTGYRWSSAGYGMGANPTGGTPLSKYSYKDIETAKKRLGWMRDYGKYVSIPLSVVSAATFGRSPLKATRPVVESIDTEDVAPYVKAAFVGADVVSGGQITATRDAFTSTSKFIGGGIDTIRDSYTEIISSTGDLGNIVGEVKDFSKIAVIGLAAVAAIMLFRR